MLPVFSRHNNAAVVSASLRSDNQNDEPAVQRNRESTDDELLRRYATSGSEEAFSQLVYRHAGWVYNFCRRRLNDAHLAEDATQAVFLLLSRKIPTMPPPAHLAGWLFQACRYVLAETRRNDKRYRRRQDVARDVMLQRISAAEASEAAPDGHLSAALDDALIRLRATERQTILMHFYEGLTLRQMADQLGISKEGAKKRVNRALAHLRQSLEGKVHRINGRRSIAGLAVVFWLLQSRRAEAAPVGLAEAVAKSASVPGFSSSMAELMVHGVVQSISRARHKLLATLLLLILELLMMVPIAVLRGRGGHGAVQVASKSPQSDSQRVQIDAKANKPSFSESLAAKGAEPTWMDPDAPSPLPRPYAPVDDEPANPSKIEPVKDKLRKPPVPVADVGNREALSERAIAVAKAASGAATSNIVSTPIQLTVVAPAPLVRQFPQIRSAILRSTRAAIASNLDKAGDEPCPRPHSRDDTDDLRFPPPGTSVHDDFAPAGHDHHDDFHFPAPPPPGDRLPLDPFDHSERLMRIHPDFALAPLENPPFDHLYPEFAAILPADASLPFDAAHHFDAMRDRQPMAAMSESIAMLGDPFLAPHEHLLSDFAAAEFSSPHFLYMSAVPEPTGALSWLIAITPLSLRIRKRPDAI